MAGEALAGPPTSAAATANYFLEKGWADAMVPPIDQMKLQKLLFYAHAWHLAIRDMPLFSDDFEAWPWGPVIRDIYYQTKEFRRDPIKKMVSRIVLTKEGRQSPLLEAVFEQPRVEDAQTREFLDAVWDAHKEYTGIQLSNATHSAGEPWAISKTAMGT